MEMEPITTFESEANNILDLLWTYGRIAESLPAKALHIIIINKKNNDDHCLDGNYVYDDDYNDSADDS